MFRKVKQRFNIVRGSRNRKKLIIYKVDMRYRVFSKGDIVNRNNGI